MQDGLDFDILYDIVIVGGSAGGMSVAVASRRSGLQRVRVLEASNRVVFSDLIGEAQVDVGYGEELVSIDTTPMADGSAVLVVNTNRLSYRTRAAMIATRSTKEGWEPSIPYAASDRIHIDSLPDTHDEDVLVIGHTDRAVELVAEAAAGGHRVVFAANDIDPTRLSPAGDNALRRLERERAITVLYRSNPDEIGIVDGFPLAYFDDRRTPDLEFDHVIFPAERRTLSPAEVGATDDAVNSGLLWFLGEEPNGAPAVTAPSFRIDRDIATAVFPEIDLPPPPSTIRRVSRLHGAVEELRDESYNAVITRFEPTHSDLWVLRVKPDTGDTLFVPGQYASLGLGYWEPRVDEGEDDNLDEKWDKLIRRSYSISSRIFDENGYLADEPAHEELEFYIVLVGLTPDNTPALTPRLALKRPGDRLYLGPKVAGRYTLKHVTSPSDTVVFLGTGTGEAPHNAMAVELLRKGHTGPIVSAVSVRQWVDLGYIEKQRTLEERYPNYHYMPLPTREADIEKTYLQTVMEKDMMQEQFGIPLEPGSTHVFLCGNPSMIGLPEDGEYPETTGVIEILEGKGFTLDKRGEPGNIHYEEYW